MEPVSMLGFFLVDARVRKAGLGDGSLMVVARGLADWKRRYARDDMLLSGRPVHMNRRVV